jgi:hypothetical protein
MIQCPAAYYRVAVQTAALRHRRATRSFLSPPSVVFPALWDRFVRLLHRHEEHLDQAHRAVGVQHHHHHAPVKQLVTEGTTIVACGVVAFAWLRKRRMLRRYR